MNDFHIIPPCKGCTERRIGCHARCDGYRLFRAMLDIKKEEVRAQSDFQGYVSAGIYAKRHCLGKRMTGKAHVVSQW